MTARIEVVGLRTSVRFGPGNDLVAALTDAGTRTASAIRKARRIRIPARAYACASASRPGRMGSMRRS